MAGSCKEKKAAKKARQEKKKARREKMARLSDLEHVNDPDFYQKTLVSRQQKKKARQEKKKAQQEKKAVAARAAAANAFKAAAAKAAAAKIVAGWISIVTADAGAAGLQDSQQQRVLRRLLRRDCRARSIGTMGVIAPPPPPLPPAVLRQLRHAGKKRKCPPGIAKAAVLQEALTVFAERREAKAQMAAQAKEEALQRLVDRDHFLAAAARWWTAHGLTPPLEQFDHETTCPITHTLIKDPVIATATATATATAHAASAA